MHNTNFEKYRGPPRHDHQRLEHQRREHQRREHQREESHLAPSGSNKPAELPRARQDTVKDPPYKTPFTRTDGRTNRRIDRRSSTHTHARARFRLYKTPGNPQKTKQNKTKNIKYSDRKTGLVAFTVRALARMYEKSGPCPPASFSPLSTFRPFGARENSLQLLISSFP